LIESVGVPSMHGKDSYPIWLLVSAVIFLLVNPSFAGTVSQSTAEFYYQQGNQYLDQGLYELAIPEYQSAIQADPKYRPAYRKLGDAYRYLKNYTSTIDNYIKFVNLSSDTADTEGKQLLIDTAKLCNEINDSENALRTLDGFLQYYYPESTDKVETTIQKYRTKYLSSLKTAPLWKLQLASTESFWQQGMLMKAAILKKLQRRIEAFRVYNKYYAQLRYRERIVDHRFNLEGWLDLFFENMLKPTPDLMPYSPWVIILSPGNSEYSTRENDLKRFEDASAFTLSGNTTNYGPTIYIIQSIPGYRITKLTFSAEINPKIVGDMRIYPFTFTEIGYNFAPQPDKKFPQETRFNKPGRQWVQTEMESKTGVRAARFMIWSSTSTLRCYQWKVKAEFIPETGTDTSIKKYNPRTPHLKIRAHPPGPTHITIDGYSNLDFSDSSGADMLPWSSAGGHTLIAERLGFTAKELRFYWNVTTDYEIDIGFNAQWNRETTNIHFPKKIKEIKLFTDNNGGYRLLAVASPDGQNDIYAASSQDLLSWSPLEKLAVNSWKNDDNPRLIQESGTDMFYLFWRSERSAEESPFASSDIWLATSLDFQTWSRPMKIVTTSPLSSSLNTGFDVCLGKINRYILFIPKGYSKSDNGITWTEPGQINYSQPPIIMNGLYYFHRLPDGRFIGLYNDYNDEIPFFISDNGIDFQKIGTLHYKNNQLKYADYYQIIEFDSGEYGLLFDEANIRYLSKSKDLVNWTDPEEIVWFSGGGMSNILKDNSGRMVFMRDSGELWSTPDLK
jgi:tetratricopeptide (TPR) repeat protein